MLLGWLPRWDKLYAQLPVLLAQVATDHYYYCCLGVVVFFVFFFRTA